METFLWADGARPTMAQIPQYVAFLKALGVGLVFLLLNDTDERDREGDGCDWDEEVLVALCHALREEGIRVGWMWWVRSTTLAVEQQLASMRRLYARFVPDVVQFDVEEDWRRDARKAYLGLLRQMMEGIKAIHRELSIPLPGVLYALSCITILMRKKLTEEDEAWIVQDMIRAFFGQSYLFHKPVASHWSHGLPKTPGRLQDLVYGAILPYLERGQIEEVWVGNAAYYQTIPGVNGLDGMRWGVAWARKAQAANAAFKGVGWWSRKHLIGNSAAPRRQIVLAASGRGGATLPDSGHPVFDLAKAAAFNGRRAAAEPGWVAKIPAMAVEHYRGLLQIPSSHSFAEAVLAYQGDHGLTLDGKLGGGTLADMRERWPAAALVGPALPPEGSWGWAQVQVETGHTVERMGARLRPGDFDATDWRIA